MNRLHRSHVLFAVLAVAVAIACVRLGIWQLGRHVEVKTAREAREARLLEEPIELSAWLDRPESGERRDVEWRRVTLSGAWRPEGEVLIRTRIRQGRPGVHVVTPLHVGTNLDVLVLRGWLPANDAMTPLPASDEAAPEPVTGRVGVIRPSREGAGLPVIPVGEGPARRLTFAALDVSAIERETGIASSAGSFFVQLLPEGSPSLEAGDPLPAQLPEGGNGPHLSYAIQWFSFALIALVGTGALLRREWRQQAPRPRALP